MTVATTILAPGSISGETWSPWYKTDTFFIVGGTPLPQTFTLSIAPETTEAFFQPFRVQVVYATDTGFEMLEEVYTGDGGDFDFTIAANTTANVYMRANSVTPISAPIYVEHSSASFISVPVNEVPSFTPAEFEPTPQESQALPPEWHSDVIDAVDDGEGTQWAPNLDPLILDLDGDGVAMAALNGTGSVYWDMNNDGFAEAAAGRVPMKASLRLTSTKTASSIITANCLETPQRMASMRLLRTTPTRTVTSIAAMTNGMI